MHPNFDPPTVHIDGKFLRLFMTLLRGLNSQSHSLWDQEDWDGLQLRWRCLAAASEINKPVICLCISAYTRCPSSSLELTYSSYHSPCHDQIHLSPSKYSFLGYLNYNIDGWNCRTAKGRHACRNGMFHMTMTRKWAYTLLHIVDFKPHVSCYMS